ncbi:MAG: glycosyltransferase [Candidatus Saccharibacteria bacterium]|nr:glycosyltransferase [Candidatus Saccharibacteria bacterium]
MIKVSVIVPVYKVPLKYLRECFASLLAQTMQECEFIVVSDGAPDAECSVCEEYADKDSRFIFFRREHAGVSATRNFGIEQAKGEYITFVDSDDRIDSECCELTYSYAKKHNSDIVLWDSRYNTKSTIEQPNLLSHDNECFTSKEQEYLCECIIDTPTRDAFCMPLVACKLFKRKHILSNKIEYPCDITICEDRIFNFKAISKANRISYLKRNFYFYRIHPNSATHKFVPDAFHKYTRFLEKFNKNECERYAVQMANTYLKFFFLSWSLDFFHKENKSKFSKKIQQLRDILDNQKTKTHLVKFSLKNWTGLPAFEIRLFKSGLTFPIYLHAIKAKLLQLLYH